MSYKTAEHVRQVAEQVGYRTGRRAVSERGTGMLGIIVADIANPVLFVMIRGAGPKASWADGVRRRSLRQAGVELDVQVRRLGPFPPTMRGGATAAERWLPEPSTAVITYNDLMAIGFIHTVMAAGRSVPRDVSVVGFDNIVDSLLVEPQLRTIAPP